MTKEFKKIQREQYELFCHKQHDYGPKHISWYTTENKGRNKPITHRFMVSYE